MLRKYIHIFKMHLQDAFYARAEGFVWFLCDMLPMLSFMFFWRVAFEGQDVIGGYTFGEMMMYYAGMSAMLILLTPHPDYDIEYNVRMGVFSNYLIKPIRYMVYTFLGEISSKVIRLVFVVPTLVLLFVFFGGGMISSIQPDMVTILLFTLACVLSFSIQFYVRYVVGCISFWTTNIVGIMDFHGLTLALFAGEILPITMLPVLLRQISQVLPFAYYYFFPLNILMGRLSIEQIQSGLLMQLIWLLVTYLTASAIFRLGIKRYEAVGG